MTSTSDTITGFLQELEKVQYVEDVFGLDCTEAGIAKIYRKLIRNCHPDLYHVNFQETCNTAVSLLTDYYEAALQRFEKKTYGAREPYIKGIVGPLTLRSRKYKYVIEGLRFYGGISGIFAGRGEDKTGESFPVYVKIPHFAEDNDLLDKEATFYAKVAERHPDRKKRIRIPNFLESFYFTDKGISTKRVANVFRRNPEYLDQWYTLKEIRERYPLGIGTRIMAFMFNRVLEALIVGHDVGQHHGAVTPNHIVIHAPSHHGYLLDWTNSAPIGQNISYLDDAYRSWYPPETLEAPYSLVPSTDVYMAAWSMVYVLGGDVAKRRLPAIIEDPIRLFLQRCLQPTIRRRYLSPKKAYDDFQEVLEKTFGPKHFVVFHM